MSYQQYDPMFDIHPPLDKFCYACGEFLSYDDLPFFANKEDNTLCDKCFDKAIKKNLKDFVNKED